MKFAAAYKVSFPDQDILSYLFGDTLFEPDEPIWFNSANVLEFVTLRQARSLTGRIGHFLRKLGVGANGAGRDVVLSFVQNQTLVAPTCFGVLCAGGVHAACSVSSTVSEVVRQITLSKPKVLICSELTRRVAEQALQRAGVLDSVKMLVMDSEALEIRSAVDGTSLGHDELSWERITDPWLLENTTAIILFSSGTTGTPKGVKHTHRNIVSNLVQMRYFFDRAATPVQKRAKRLRMPGIIQNSAPAGILIHSMMALQTGMEVFLVARYDFKDLANMIRDHDLSVLFLVPAIYLRIAQTFEAKDLKNVRWALSGASPLSTHLQAKISDMLPEGVNLNVNWGMTETTCGGSQLEPNEKDTEGSVGRLLPGMEAIIVGPDDTRHGFGQPGELFLKGPNIIKSYFENPAATEAAFSTDGWFRTGDIGRMDKSGKLFIEGRSKELLKYKGNQISPSELEGILGECPGVQDAGVVSIGDGQGNDLPRAYIVRSKGRECRVNDVMQFMDGRVSEYKKLRGGVVFVDDIPRNANGKIMRDVLKIWATTESGKSSQHKL